MTQAACLAHVRRKFTDAQKARPSKKAGKIENAQPIWDEFHQWLLQSQSTALPKSAIGKAINYTLNQWPKLLTYLKDGDISIDNNVTERDIRPFTTGQKNWMFSTSVGGAKASANLYSLVMTCRANDINFQHLFTELPKRQPTDDLTDLMPWNVNISEAK